MNTGPLFDSTTAGTEQTLRPETWYTLALDASHGRSLELRRSVYKKCIHI